MSKKAGSDTAPNWQTFEAIVPGESQAVAVGAGSVQSSAMPVGTTVARLVSTVACFVKTGANPTALADGTSMYLPANVPTLIGIDAAEKIAVIQASSGGFLYVTAGE